jgi:hypothetical protein
VLRVSDHCGWLRVIVNPRILDWRKAETRERFCEQPRHLDRVGDDKAPAVSANQERPGACFTATVDAVAPAAGDPCEIALSRQDDAGHAGVACHPRDAVEFDVRFPAHNKVV